MRERAATMLLAAQCLFKFCYHNHAVETINAVRGLPQSTDKVHSHVFETEHAHIEM